MPSLLEINTEKCTGCGDCVEKCPVGAVELIDGKAVVVHPDVCTYCTECETFCDSRAITCPFEIVLAEPHKPPQATQKTQKRARQTGRRKSRGPSRAAS